MLSAATVSHPPFGAGRKGQVGRGKFLCPIPFDEPGTGHLHSTADKPPGSWTKMVSGAIGGGPKRAEGLSFIARAPGTVCYRKRIEEV